MTAPARASALLTVVLVAALTGCEAEPERPTRPTGGGESATAVERPHFTGARDVSLVVGRSVYGEPGCRGDQAPAWVCDPAQGSNYITVGEPRRAELVEARMEVADGGTSWDVTVRFHRTDRRPLLQVRDAAAASGAVVLVLDATGEVLVTATVPDVEGRTIRLGELTKPQAWDTVELIGQD